MRWTLRKWCWRASAAVVSSALVLLSSRNAAAFRTIEDLEDVPDGARVHWYFGLFDYRVHEDPSDSIDVSTLAEVSQRAFAAWTTAPCARIVPGYRGMTPGLRRAG